MHFFNPHHVILIIQTAYLTPFRHAENKNWITCSHSNTGPNYPPRKSLKTP